MKKKKKEKKRWIKNKTLRVSIKIFLITFLAVCCICAGLLLGVVAGCILTTQPLTDIDLKISDLTSTIYDSKGNVIQTFTGTDYSNSEWANYDEVPKNLIKGLIDIEDERFYKHSGIDIKRTIGAGLSFFIPGMGNYGGSTITQQVVKNVTGDDARSVPRKIREQWRAIQLERTHSKEEILEIYVNVIAMGHNMTGVKIAAKAYFNKDLSELSLAECALLAGITNNPSKYDPFTTTGRANAIKRQELILKKMLDLGDITEDDYNAALKEELHFNENYKASMPVTSIYSYFVDQVISDVRTDLIKSGYTEKQANNLIYNSGISIYATQDSDIQAAIDSEFTNIENFPINKNLEPDKQGQAAMVILDQRNGQILGMYGGYGKKEASLSFNRATQMYRSPGSSIKPLLIYGPAIDNHLITPATVVDDSPCRLDPQYPDKLWPTNFSNNYRGLTTVRQAIIDSTNVVATKTFLDYTGYDLGLSYLKNLGMDRYEDKGKPAISLGGFYKAMNPMLMAAGYAAFANDGSYYEPTTYTKVVDNSGKTLLDKKPISTLVYKDDRTPYMMTNMLHDVVTKGSASQNINIKNAAGESIYTAGKTGTSTDQEDLWFVGYTAYYTCATWYGYDNSKSVPSGDEYFTSQRLWNKVMTKIHANLEPKEFTRPDGIVEADVCKVSGEMPTQICLDDPRGEVYREIFMSGTEPSSPCSVHKSVQICDLSHDNFGKHELAGPFCPIADVNTVWGTYRKVLPDFRPGDPFPDDWGYELSHAGICTLHNSVEPPPENTTMPATPDMPIDTPSPSPSITYPDTPSPPEQTPVISTQTPEPEPEPEETLSPDE